MIILSLDLSLNRSGWAVIDTSKRQKKSRILGYGVINNKHLDSSKTGLKLYHIECSLKAILYAYNPNVIVVEALSGSAWVDTTQLSKVHGVLEKVTMKFNNIHYINNMTFKRDFTGKGTAKKDDVKDKVLEYLPDVVIRYDDESDAIGIAILFSIQEKLCTW